MFITGTTDGDLNGQSIVSASAAFLEKYNSSGVRQWTRLVNAAAFFSCTGSSVTCDASDNIYIGGFTNGAVSDQVNVSGNNDYFVTKFNTAGTEQWSRQLGASENRGSQSRSVATDSSSNVYVAGYTAGSVDGQPQVSDDSTFDGFVTKYNSNGDKITTYQFGTAGALRTVVENIHISNTYIYLTGYTRGALGGQTKVSDAGSDDFYVIRVTELP